MTLGEKIRFHRTKLKLTQKDLSEKLNITYQGVSRWEQDLVQPSIDSLMRMADIFSVSLDELVGNPNIPKPLENNPFPQPIIIQQSSQPIDNRRTIGVCETCNKPILEGDSIHRVHTRARSPKTILCESCNEERERKIEGDYKRVTKKNRFWAFLWGILAGAFFLYISIQGLLDGSLEVNAFQVGLLTSYLSFSFLFTFTMKNNFIHNFFWDITSFGFVRLPGIIFSFDIDGLLFLITAKVILFFIGIGIALVAGSIALFISLLLSGFVLPFSIYNAFTNPKKTEII